MPAGWMDLQKIWVCGDRSHIGIIWRLNCDILDSAPVAWVAVSSGKIVEFRLQELDQPSDTMMDQITIGDMPADTTDADAQIFSSLWD